MKKNVKIIIVFVIFLFAFGMEAMGQVAKEGTTSGTMTYSGTPKVLPMGQERLQMTYESFGVHIGDTPEDIFHNASVRCLGSLHAVKGEYTNNGFCVATRPDGDKIFYTIQSKGKLGGAAKGSTLTVGGTGKMTGAQGNSEYTDFPLRPAAEGTFQGFTKWKGQYKLP